VYLWEMRCSYSCTYAHAYERGENRVFDGRHGNVGSKKKAKAIALLGLINGNKLKNSKLTNQSSPMQTNTLTNPF